MVSNRKAEKILKHRDFVKSDWLFREIGKKYANYTKSNPRLVKFSLMRQPAPPFFSLIAEK